MRIIFFISVIYIISIVIVAFFTTSNKEFTKKIYFQEDCRAKAMSLYEAAWNECCAKSGQSIDCKANLPCEPSWDTYSKQMSSCEN